MQQQKNVRVEALPWMQRSVFSEYPRRETKEEKKKENRQDREGQRFDRRYIGIKEMLSSSKQDEKLPTSSLSQAFFMISSCTRSRRFNFAIWSLRLSL